MSKAKENFVSNPPIFDAHLTAHRSMGQKGFAIIMGLIGVISLGCGVFFFMLGAWPVTGFFGLDVFALYFAFKFNFRAARYRENITLWQDQLLVSQISPSGHVVQHKFNPFWTRFEVSRHELIGVTRMRLCDRSNDRSRVLSIGALLNPEDRKSFAHAFSLALSQLNK